MIALVSGLTLARESSFARQLRLLATALAAAGRRCLLAGTGDARPFDDGSVDLPRITAAALAEAARRPLEAAILLGYPDQFPLLVEPGPPLFLWAQCSRPPAPGALGRAVPIPLTERTRAFLERAGSPNLGPTIPHAVDTEVFRPADPQQRRSARAALGADDETLVVGTVGANTTRKRLDLLVAAFAAITRSPALLVVKTDRERAPGGFDLPALALRHGVDRRVRIVCELLAASTLAGLYSALDVYAHAAEWEGFCVPAVEAMACGVPVVAADTQGPGETVPYREGLVGEGQWIDEGGSRLFHVSPPALAAAVDLVAEDTRLRARLGGLGRAEAVRRFDLRAVAGQWLATLDAAPGGRGFRRGRAAV